jgi:hypothetical protein
MMENTESQSSELLTQNAELMTQNELTQLGDDDMALSPLPPQSPLNPQSIPWGRLIPCSRHLLQEGEQRGGIDLLPVGPRKQESGAAVGVSFLGLNVHSGDVFNEYVLGRSHKCDVIAAKLPQDEETIGKDAAALHDWAHAMISNRHCRIYCMLSTDNSRGNNKQDMQVYIEDTSGNGTLINNTTLLRRGEKRLLHTGDEISLVNPATLSKKIRSNDMLRDLQRHHSFIFVNVFAQQQHSILDTIRQRQSNSMRPPSSVKQHRDKHRHDHVEWNKNMIFETSWEAEHVEKCDEPFIDVLENSGPSRLFHLVDGTEHSMKRRLHFKQKRPFYKHLIIHMW